MREPGRGILPLARRATRRWARRVGLSTRSTDAPLWIAASRWIAVSRWIAASRRVAASRWAAACVSLGCAAACAWTPFAPRAIPDCPGAIRSTREISGDFTLRERVVVRGDGVDFPFELIVQKRAGEIVLVGLSPLGAKLFSVVQTGSETEVDALPAAALPIPPLNVVRDFHRFRFAQPGAADSGRGSAVFDHPECGYSIRFETLSETPP